MRNLFWVILMIASVSIIGICQNNKPAAKKEKPTTKRTGNQKCIENPDALYDRQKIIEQLAEILNISVFGIRKGDFVFYAEDEKPRKFTIFDLTETTNKGTPLSNCIEFRDSHIYHFSPIEKRYSFSHIVILENGGLKIFKSINCKGKGDSLEDVMNYLSLKLEDNKNKQRILDRVKDYRRYGIYTTTDTPKLQCN